MMVLLVDFHICISFPLIRRSLTYLNGLLLKRLFTTFLRSHLEYGLVIWAPYLKKFIITLEKVQYPYTKLVDEEKVSNYIEWLWGWIFHHSLRECSRWYDLIVGEQLHHSCLITSRKHDYQLKLNVLFFK